MISRQNGSRGFVIAAVVWLWAAGFAGAESTQGVKVMSTRGFALTSVLDKSAGKEAITAYRFELPYGLAAGWKVPYLGFSEGATYTIQLNDVVVSLAMPDKPVTRLRVTFGGQHGAAIAPNAVVESDPVDLPVLPGGVIVVSTFYRNQNPGGPLPFMTWGYLDGIDGCLVGDIRTLSSDRLFDDKLDRGATPPLPLWAGLGPLIRSYQPMFIAGRPHPSFTGAIMPVGFIGDSINIANGDFGRATPDDPFPARGWNGRACGIETPYVVFGQSGSNAGGFLGAQRSALFKYIFGTGAGDAKVSCLVDGYGINTMRQQSKARAPGKVWRDRLEVAGIVSKLGLPYIHTTMTPMKVNCLIPDPALGDLDACFALFVAERKAFNEQVRRHSSAIPGCVGFVDWGEAVETDPATSNNLWQPNLAPDGIHPNTDGYQRMAKAAKAVLQALKAKMTDSAQVGK